MSVITPETNPYGPVDPEGMLSPAEVEDDTALRLVVQDAESAAAWLSTNYFSVRWLEADILYQSPPISKTWEGTSVPRANISCYTIATHLNAILAQIMNALFYDDPAFTLRPRPRTTQNAVRAITAVMGAQLDAIGFREEAKRGLFSALLFGTGIWKWGWETFTKTEKKYKRKGEPVEVESRGKTIKLPTRNSEKVEVVETDKVCNRPTFEALDVRYCLVDPGCRTGDIRDAKFVIHKSTMTYRDLIKLRDEQEALGSTEYQLPGEEEIRWWFEPPTAASNNDGAADSQIVYPGTGPYVHHAAPRLQKTTADPLDEPLEVLERWDNEKVITVLQRARVIRNTSNPVGELPFLSVNWWDIQDAFWGLGLGLLLGSEQRIQQGLTNACVDIASLIVNPQIIRARGANITSQSIRQRLGGIIDVDGDPKTALQYAPVPTIPAEVFAQIQESQARSEAVSGANELLTMGNMPSKGRTSIGRTATGASALSSAAASRIGSFSEDFCNQVFAPFLWRLHELNCERLPVTELREVLNDELGEDFELDEAEYFGAAIKKFEVLAGSKLAVRQQMAQSITLMMQLFESPQTMQELAQVNGEYVDVAELLHMISDVSGWKNYYSIVKKMTPEMQKRMMAMNPAVIQANSKAALQAQKTHDQTGILEQKDINRSVVLALRDALENSIRNETVTGQPGGVGFGSEEQG
ncbi:MAG TPA: hypothetical protein VHU83_06690 [Bryobacteraceae bacterium]|jgi:hypothetical protein|nr:hypothetical protein [Bryobacteraceae bacterium]